jgi:hypothetical protein
MQSAPVMRDARHFSPTEVDPGQKKHWGSDFWYRHGPQLTPAALNGHLESHALQETQYTHWGRINDVDPQIPKA